MAVLTLKPARSIKESFGGGPENVNMTPAAASSWIIGDLLVQTDNTAVICGANPTVVSFISPSTVSDTVPGISTLSVQKVRPSSTFVMSAYSATPSSATVPDSALDGQANYGIIRVTVSGVVAWTLNLDDSTQQIRVRLLKRLDLATDTYPQCEVQFLDSICTFK